MVRIAVAQSKPVDGWIANPIATASLPFWIELAAATDCKKIVYVPETGRGKAVNALSTVWAVHPAWLFVEAAPVAAASPRTKIFSSFI